KAAKKEVGAEELPDIFASYSDTAFTLDKMDAIADISPYLTKSEIEEFVPEYLEDGMFSEDGSIKIFPIAKSTEIMLLNKTAWDKFKGETGVTEDDLGTWEGVARVSEKYYNWSDGSAFFGRDAMANYILIGAKQLGSEIFTYENGEARINLSKPVMRRLWDNFYVPYIKGYYGAYGKFRSDDLRTNKIISFVGSTSSAAFFPESVTDASGNLTPIECEALKLPNFEGTEPLAVCQGAGMVVSKSTEDREKASVEFLKWFTQPKQNVEFSMTSGYLPVKKNSGLKAQLDEISKKNPENIKLTLKKTLSVSADMSEKYKFYTNKPFTNGYNARLVVDSCMNEAAKKDCSTIERLMADNKITREEACKSFLTDEYFDSWFEKFSTELKGIQIKD
ncbi:MAG: extracellular solute-binding protein, partial [Oscillospiraceae bacterium]